MAEETTVVQDTPEDKGKTFDEAYVKELRDEAASNRVAAKQLQEKLDAIQAETQKREAEEAAKRGEFEDLYKSSQAELDKIKADAEKYQASVNKYLEAEIESIPEDKRALIPNLDADGKLEWIKAAKAAGVFGKSQTAPNPKLPGEGNDGSITRVEFETKSPAEKMKFVQSGGKITD